MASAPGAAGRFDTGGILFPSTGLSSHESALGSKDWNLFGMLQSGFKQHHFTLIVCHVGRGDSA